MDEKLKDELTGALLGLIILTAISVLCGCKTVRYVPVETVDQVFAAALCPEREIVREEVADPVAAFAPVNRETGRDA